MTNPLEVPLFPEVRACNIICGALGTGMSAVSIEEALLPLEPQSSKGSWVSKEFGRHINWRIAALIGGRGAT